MMMERFRVIDVGESGFTLRVLTGGVYSGIDGTTLLIPRGGSLIGRPMDELLGASRTLALRLIGWGGV